MRSTATLDGEPVQHQSLSRSSLSHLAEDEDTLGFFARARISIDAASNTAYGPLLAHSEVDTSYGNGFDNANGVSIPVARAPPACGPAAASTPVTSNGPASPLVSMVRSSPSSAAATLGTTSLGRTTTGGSQVLQLAYTTLRRRLCGDGRPRSAFADRGQQRRYRRLSLEPVTRTGTRAPDIIAALDLTQSWAPRISPVWRTKSGTRPTSATRVAM